MDDRPRVAFIEDDAEIRLVVLDALSSEGMDVYVAERESVDVSSIAGWQPDVIFVNPRGALAATRPPFSVALAMAEDERLAAVPLVVMGDPWTLWEHGSEVDMLRPSAILRIPFSVDELVELVSGIRLRQRMVTRSSAAGTA